MKKVLVTGCSGLVGVHLIKKSLEMGYEVVGVDINEKSIHLKDYDFKFYKLDLTKEENIFEYIQKRQLEENVKLKGDGQGWHKFLAHILAKGCLNSNQKTL
jgi:nucleoside-diphosphate-sugar epimerase